MQKSTSVLTSALEQLPIASDEYCMSRQHQKRRCLDTLVPSQVANFDSLVHCVQVLRERQVAAALKIQVMPLSNSLTCVAS